MGRYVTKIGHKLIGSHNKGQSYVFFVYLGAEKGSLKCQEIIQSCCPFQQLSR